MDKTLLLFYDSGLGDVLQITPQMRYYYKKGYLTTLMCRKEVVASHLLDNCPYINDLCIVKNPWASDDYVRMVAANRIKFAAKCNDYDLAFHRNHQKINVHKLDVNNKLMGIHDMKDFSLEVFISNEAKEKAKDYISKYNGDYIFVHTNIANHPNHSWNARKWIRENLSDLPIIDTGLDMPDYMIDEDINVTFEIAKRARFRVLSSSVMVHACDAMGVTIDAVNYGFPDRKVWPVNIGNVLRMRENDHWMENFRKHHLLYSDFF